MLKMASALHYIWSHVYCPSLCVPQLTSAKYVDPTTSISFRFTPHHVQDWRSCETAPASSSGGLRPRSFVTCPNGRDRITCMPLTPMGFEDFLEPHIPAPVRKAGPPVWPHFGGHIHASTGRPRSSSSCAGAGLGPENFISKFPISIHPSRSPPSSKPSRQESEMMQSHPGQNKS